MMTQVYITQSAWCTILEEVKFFATQENREAIVYPMFGFIRSSDCMKAPWEMLELYDLESFVVTHAHAPLRKFCEHTNIRAKFNLATDADKLEFNEDIIHWSKPLNEMYPTLEIGNVHSHPFARGWTYPSSGNDQMDYPRIYKLWQHMCGRMVNSSLEIILCRAIFSRNKWKACCFSFDEKQKIVSLGKAHIISDDDPQVKKVLALPYWKTNEGARWEKMQQDQVPEIQAFDRYFFGWSTVRMKFLEQSLHLFVHLPPQFPKVERVIVQGYDEINRKWLAKKFFSLPRSTSYFPLKEIIQKYLERGDNYE